MAAPFSPGWSPQPGLKVFFSFFVSISIFFFFYFHAAIRFFLFLFLYFFFFLFLIDDSFWFLNTHSTLLEYTYVYNVLTFYINYSTKDL